MVDDAQMVLTGAGAEASRRAVADRAVTSDQRAASSEASEASQFSRASSRTRTSRALHGGSGIVLQLRPRSADGDSFCSSATDGQGILRGRKAALRCSALLAQRIARPLGTVLCNRRSTPAECARKQRAAV